MATPRLRVLVVAPHSPHPPSGGGTATLNALLAALPSVGVEVRVVALQRRAPHPGAAPYAVQGVAAAPRTWLGRLPALASRTPLAVSRYRVAALSDAVDGAMASFAPHVVHLEQLHVAWLLDRLAAQVPVVLREQNVEWLLLSRVAGVVPPPVRWAVRWEGARTRRFERRVCERAALVAAISEADAAALRILAPRARVAVLPAAFAAAPARPERLLGSPPFLCLGSFDWFPNRDGARWLLHEVWPLLRRLVPTGVLHLAGPGSASLPRPRSGATECHGTVASPGSLYDPAAVALIPLRAGSGVRIRLLEAWAAGVPAVVSACAAEGLLAEDGDGALIAATPHEFARAAAQVAADGSLRARLVERGRGHLERHAADRVALRARELYLEAASPRP